MEDGLTMAKKSIGDNRVDAKLADYRALVERFLELGEISKKELAESAGVSYATLRNFLLGHKLNQRYRTVDKIMFAVAHELIASDAPPPSPPSKKRRGRKA